MSIQVLEITNPTDSGTVMAKIDKRYQADINSQLIKQMAFGNGDKTANYKFDQDFNTFSLFGCWFKNIDYTNQDHIQVEIQYDNSIVK